jgi:hypothetical protein
MGYRGWLTVILTDCREFPFWRWKVQERGNRALFAGFRARNAAFDKLDLAVVIGLVLGEVDPFAVIVSWSLGEIFVDGH